MQVIAEASKRIAKDNNLIANMIAFIHRHGCDIDLPNDGLFSILPDEILLYILCISSSKILDTCIRMRLLLYDVLIYKITLRGDVISSNILWERIIPYKSYQFISHALFLKFIYRCKKNQNVYICKNMEMHYTDTNMCFIYEKETLIKGKITRFDLDKLITSRAMYDLTDNKLKALRPECRICHGNAY